MLPPRSTRTRELLRLDGLWRFALDAADAPRPYASTLQTRREAPVPASYNDIFADQEIHDHVGWVWYQRTVRVPRGWSGERVFLRVDAATHEGAVYVGDRLVAQHVGGYTPFEADITELAIAGEEIRVTIGVNNELTNRTIPPGTISVDERGRRRQSYRHDFFNYAGLPRSVWLYSVPDVHVTALRTRTTITGTTGVVHYDVEASGEAEVRVRLVDEDGETAAEAGGASGALSVPDAELWRPGHGYLYELQVELLADEAVVDAYGLPVGIRTVEVRGARFLINGEPFAFRGFGKHEDSAIRGKGRDDALLVHDFALMEWVGANSFRTAHYPYAEETLEYADRHGIVVIDETAAVGLNLGLGGGVHGVAEQAAFSPEMFDEHTQRAHAQAIRELIDRDRNHPSVVMWCLMNEPDSVEPGSREYFAPLVELARELDPTRPLTFAGEYRAHADTDSIADLFDVITLNRYYGWYSDSADLVAAERHLEQELRAWTDAYDKPIMIGEYGADSYAGLHSVLDQPWSEEYQQRLLETFHRVFDRIDAVVGEHVWNFADFQTSPGFFRVDGNKKGVFTRDRQPKAAAHVLRARWRG
ncbi:Beta-glucuronidase [Microbacterium hydrocarbonoxydans]|uniref:Beta-glucuronidase n=1 Tax=Microbacterium hydrocarbonoxydans TaxID=273678 RepID=A0A0M2HS35_9MICO|nr:beta-glucuronidase [Microbacterium hydrocarbonoxydans]KJL47299.1 Beta-glucuronidase [Microbacterium hydrocarbonoxydans]